MIIVVDASVTISWIAQDEQSEYASATLAAIADDVAFVPAIWHWEMENTLLVLERKKRLPDAIATFLRVIRLPIEIERLELSRDRRATLELELARKYRLSAYDSAYLALAKATAQPLSTLDARLASAAREERVFFEA